MTLIIYLAAVVFSLKSGIVKASVSFDTRFSSSVGLFPSVFNLAEGADIFVNATCGQYEAEVYCTLSSALGSVSNAQLECGVCDASKSDKSHSIESAVDGTDSWWQSPSLQYGPEFQFVTITIDLKQVFQVAYLLLKSGPSPRPGNWVLERSINGHDWAPWQFFAISDEECWHAFGIEPVRGKPEYQFDEEVICTSYYSGLDPMENGEVHISLVNSRPGASGPSRTLVDFTQARFIRLRFQRLRMLNQDQHVSYDFLDKFRLRQYFYSIRDITIGGQCPCNGHASDCPVNPATMEYQCKCEHNTCGPLCNQCCPMFNQKRWQPGKFITGHECESCQCFGHADECIFDPQVEAERGSLNIHGDREGGGVCIGCRDDTIGVNCQLCKKGFFRPAGVSRYDPKPCRKCNCNSFGSTGSCYPDDSQVTQGHQPGDCICKPGYAGSDCSECARGYHQYPNCTPCPCSLAGTLNGECDGFCLCKENVQGERCDQCKAGYYALSESNPKGCLQCFCYAVTNECESANLGVEIIQNAEGWQATDLRGKIRLNPYWSTMTSGVTIAEEDMRGADTYFWEAPEVYQGNRLQAYGQTFRIRTSYHRGRGDTSGMFIKCPDIILMGDGMTIATGFRVYENDANTTLEAKLMEDQWYHIPEEIENIPASAFTDGLKPDFIGRRVFKDDFMRVLGSLERILIRAKYHTDQLEGSLYTAALEVGSETSTNLQTRTFSVERCQCPVGYEGLSCEKCSFGYTRVNETLFAGECRQCDCHGHAASCDPVTFECNSNGDSCLHNTEGQKCERCKVGFYGDARNGSPDDCKPCKCPMDVPSNNFSPTCEAASMEYDKYAITPQEYICTACPRGYVGPHCERCDNGYFGNPLKVGDFCKPCDCSGNANIYAPNWCDHRTGECLQCLGNTAGWKCDQCLDGHWGNPFAGRCKACDCNPHGSLGSDCDLETGQCRCKPKYIGRTCGQCDDGFGNVKAGCRRCDCDQTGSMGDACDADSGQCMCRNGVGGLKCTACLDHYYGFSLDGCKACDCHPEGAKQQQCDLHSGQCQCYQNVEGKQCKKCRYGYWNINSGQGCEKCHCDPMGSYDSDCNDVDGQCKCKPGVGGQNCDNCRVGFWGFSHSGCIECAPCDKPGHICDPDTGRCICPPLTDGTKCERCALGSWDYDSYKGCKPCRCHERGSVSPQCDALTGLCECVQGYEGDRCDRCSPGYYNFPNCRPCNCDPDGTDPSQCDNKGTCQCDPVGACKCKESVEGKKCASCKLGTFGLSKAHPKGCFDCFCFGRSNTCKQGNFAWTQLRMRSSRRLIISRGSTELNVTNDLLVVPDTEDSAIKIGVESLFTTPLYWSLPDMFLGDKILSYNGFLRFTLENNGDEPYPPSVLDEFPLVQLQGNHKIVLEHFPRKISPNGRYEVRMHEKDWIVKGSRQSVTRDMIMIALQRLQRLLIRTSDTMEATETTLSEVSLDIGRPVDSDNYVRKAIGLEVCKCPPEYGSSSCQDPGSGFYRWYKEQYTLVEYMIDLVGKAKKCECNGRSDTCDMETGNCLNCRENTGGDHCDVCNLGYYGNPMTNDRCKPCQCPTAQNNFAETCSVSKDGIFSCQCKPGYTGPKCERCDYGYYGNPREPFGECSPCNCNPLGSVSDQCDQHTGQCFCVSGVTGRDCSQCQPKHVLSKAKECKDCNNYCIGNLMNKVKSLDLYLNMSEYANLDPTPHLTLQNFKDQTEDLEMRIRDSDELKTDIKSLKSDIDLLKPQAEILDLEAEKLREGVKDQLEQVPELITDAELFEQEITYIMSDIRGIIEHLQNYGIEDNSDVRLTPALEEARAILKSIQKKDFREADIEARLALSRSRQTLNMVKQTLFGDTEIDDMKAKIEEADFKLNDLLKHIDTTLVNIRKAFDLINSQNEILRKSKRINKKVEEETSKLKRYIEETEEKNDENRNILIETEDIARNLKEKLQKLELMKPDFIREVLVDPSEIDKLRSEYVIPSQINAEKLEKSAEELRTKFRSIVGVDADETVRAANMYRDIVEGVESARQAAYEATNATNIAYRNADPPGEDQLNVKAEAARIRSEDLYQEARGVRQNVMDMEVQLQQLRGDLRETMSRIQKYHRTLDNIKKELEIILQPLKGYMDEAKMKAQESFDVADRASQATLMMMLKIDEELKQKMNELKSFSPQELAQIPRKLNDAKRQMNQVDKQSAYLSYRARDVEELSLEVSRSLSALTNKIAMARHAADSVKISIRNDWEETDGCLRTYRINRTSSMTTEISLIYAIDTDDRDALLVYLPSTRKGDAQLDNRDFMAIEMVDRKIRFLWNNGAGTHSIQSDVVLEQARNLGAEDHMWYRITVQRIGNSGRLNVRRVQPVYDLPEYHKWDVGESSVDAHVMDLERDDLLYVGGVPEVYKSRYLLSNGRFAGVLSALFYDQQNIGLWNFVSTRGCRETHIGVTESESGHNCYTFSGRGYAQQRGFRNYDTRYLSLSLEFRSYDTNAIIMLLTNQAKDQYMVLSLRDGKIHLVLFYGQDLKLEFQSTNTYNSGTWVKVEAARAIRNGIETGLLKVNFNGVQEEQMNTLDLPRGAAFDMAECDVFFGGVPPTFQSQNPQLTSNISGLLSLLGSMRGITVTNPGSNSVLNPLHAELDTYTPYYGVEANCDSKLISLVSFNGDGFLELKSQSFKSKSSFGFGFKTIEPEGLIVLSTFQGLEDKGDLNNFFSISLTAGRPVFIFSSGSDPLNKVRITCDKVLNDGRIHNIVVVRNGRRLRIFVDDEEIIETKDFKLSHNFRAIQAPENGGLFLGGIPSLIRFGVKSGNMSATMHGFKGTIQNMAFLDNDSIRIVSMNEPLRFQNADIGREMSFSQMTFDYDFHYSYEESGMNVSSGRRDCSTLNVIDGRQAAHFSRHLESKLSLKLNKEDLQRDFQLSFLIRTYDQDGLIFASVNKKNMLLLYLQDTELKVQYHHRGSVLEMEVTDTFSYGRWKNVRLIKNGADLTVIVDGYKSASMNVPKRLHLSKSVWLGGIDEEPLEEFDVSKLVPTFSGCIKDFTVTSRKIYLISDMNKMTAITECPGEVERGFFIKNGVISAKANILALFVDVSLNFKIFKPGMVLHLRHSNGFNVEISLNETKVILSVKNNNKRIWSHTSQHDLQFNYCSSPWNALRLQMRDQRATLSLNNRRMESPDHYYMTMPPEESEIELRVGDLAGFSGCVKDVVFNGNHLGSSRFDMINDVYLHSCPK